MSNKIVKLGRDYVGIGRKCMAVDVLPTGAPMWYDKDLLEGPPYQ